MKTIVCFGEVLLRLTAPGHEPLLRSPRLDACFGGAEINTAVSLACFGHRICAVTCLPDNAIGDACMAELSRHRLDTSGIRRVTGRMGLYFFTNGAMLRPSRVLYDRANSAFADADPGAYDWSLLLSGADWLHISGITPALGTGPAQALNRAVAEATRRGTRISFDCNIRPSLWRGREADAVDVLSDIARQADLLFGNPHDISRLFGGAFLDPRARDAQAAAAERALASCPRLQHVAATHRIVHSADHHTLTGFLVDRRGIAGSRAYELKPIIERLGAGDAFAAGVLHGVCEDLALQDTIDFATAAAALKHTLPGDFSTLSVDDVRHLIANAGLDVQR